MPLKDGLFKIEFQTPLGAGAGVVVLEQGRVRGGDSIMYYSGTYRQNGDDFSANVVAKKHSQGVSVMGGDASLSIQGKVTGDAAMLTGSAAEAPQLKLKARLSRIE
ncbi:MAG: GrlR family regulatory protein [Parvibaculum sp.]|nr:GrlR family regulatory protein [Parvibaculum sp.]MDZ4369063.1 GrlR family regulatory protein [Afipia sp.]